MYDGVMANFTGVYTGNAMETAKYETLAPVTAAISRRYAANLFVAEASSIFFGAPAAVWRRPSVLPL